MLRPGTVRGPGWALAAFWADSTAVKSVLTLIELAAGCASAGQASIAITTREGRPGYRDAFMRTCSFRGGCPWAPADEPGLANIRRVVGRFGQSCGLPG